MTNNFIHGYMATGSDQNSATQLPGTNGTYLIGASAMGSIPVGVRLPEPSSIADAITLIPVQADIFVYPAGTNGFFNYSTGNTKVLVKAGNTLTFLSTGVPAIPADPDNWYTYPNPLAGVIVGSGGSGGLTPNLEAIDAIFPGNGTFIVGNGVTWTGEGSSTVAASLGLAIGTNVQAHANILDSLSSLNSMGILTINGTNIVSGLLTVSGDTTGTSSGTNLNLTLGTSGVTAGTYGDNTHAIQINVDSKGRITSASTGTVSLGTGTITEIDTGTGLTGGPITGIGTISMATSGVTAGTYGDSTHTNRIVVDALGRITNISTSSIPVGTGTVTSIAVTGTDGIGVTGSPITSSGTIALSLGSITPVTINSTGGQGTADVAMTLNGVASGTGDYIDAKNSGGTVLAKIDYQGNITGANLSGTNTGDQIITLTGDVTGSGTGSFATTIATNAITTAKINNSAITYAKIQNETANTLLGNSGTVAAAPSEIAIGTGLTLSAGTLTASATPILFVAGSGTASATGTGAFAAGGGAGASGLNAIAIGTAADASGTNSLAIGHGALGTADYAVALGYGADASQPFATAINDCVAAGSNSVAIGISGTAAAANTIVIGNGTAGVAGQTIIGYNSGTLTIDSGGTLNAASILNNGSLVATLVAAAPVHPTDAGAVGHYYADGSYAYFYSSAGTWIRVAADLSWV